MYEALLKFDKDIFLLINGAHNIFFDEVMWWVSKAITWLPVYFLLLFFIIKKYKTGSVFIILLIALLITLSDMSSVHLFKNVFQRLRPCHAPDLQGLVHIIHNKCGGKYGFVSSHAANFFGIATYFFLILRKDHFSFSVLLFVWATLIAYSRVYLGVHYPADIFAGALLGILCGFAVYSIYLYIIKKYGKKIKCAPVENELHC